MAKWKKFILCIFTFLIALIAINTIITYQALGPFSLRLMELTDLPIIGGLAGVVLYYVALIVLVIAIVSFFVILLWRKKISKITYKKPKGNLAIDETAIEKAVIHKLEKQRFLTKPKVDVDIHGKQNSIDITIYADVIEGNHVGIQSENLLNSLTQDMETMFDFSKEQTKLTLELQSTEVEHNKEPRVV